MRESEREREREREGEGDLREGEGRGREREMRYSDVTNLSQLLPVLIGLQGRAKFTRLSYFSSFVLFEALYMYTNMDKGSSS